MNATETLEPTEATTPRLTSADRCDLCGSRAWVRAVMKTGSLHFCAHHSRGNMEALREQAIEIIDERHILLSEESFIAVSR